MTAGSSATAPRYPFVHVEVSGEGEREVASLWLWELGALGIEERDTTTLEQPAIRAAGAVPGCTLVGSFADESAAQDAALVLAERWPARVEITEGDAWRDGWRAYFKPARVGRRLVIRPSWEPYEAASQDVVLTLDPGGAFGTGTHESTRLVLQILEERLVPGVAVLDVGCGSGVLAVAALRLGAGRAVAIDVDPAAELATRENALANGVAAHLEVSTTPLVELAGRFPLVLSNIEAHVLVPMAADLCPRLDPGGLLVLSGILARQADAVVSAYVACAAMRCVEQRVAGEWVALVLERDRDG